MKIIKNRYLIAGLCLLAAGIIAFAVLPQFYSGREATATVYRAGVSIPQGTLIEQSHIVSVEVGAFNLPDSAITDSTDIIGQYALINIPKDDLLLPDKLGAFLHSESLDKLMKRNQRLVTVSLPSNAAGVAGHPFLHRGHPQGTPGEHHQQKAKPHRTAYRACPHGR